MKIIIATRFFYPEITPRAFRSYELAKRLSRLGHDVTVVTTRRAHDYTGLTRETGVKVDAVIPAEPSFLCGGGTVARILRFILNHFLLYPSCFLVRGFSNYFKNGCRCDLLISIAYPYPVHFGIGLAKKKNPNLCNVWVADCGDPFTGNRESRLPIPFYFKFIERWFLRIPDYITVPVEEAIGAYCKGFHQKFKVIPQGFDFSECAPSGAEVENEVPTFAYAGNLSTSVRDPRPLLEFLAERGIKFKFIIYTRNKGFLAPYVSKLRGMLELRDYVPRRELFQHLSAMDFLVNFENKGESQKPSKLIDYALIGRPVLSIPHGKLNESVILEFLCRNYSHALKIGDISSYDINNVAKEFAALGSPLESQTS